MAKQTILVTNQPASRIMMNETIQSASDHFISLVCRSSRASEPPNTLHTTRRDQQVASRRVNDFSRRDGLGAARRPRRTSSMLVPELRSRWTVDSDLCRVCLQLQTKFTQVDRQTQWTQSPHPTSKWRRSSKGRSELERKGTHPFESISCIRCFPPL